MVVGVDVGLVSGTERMIAMRAGGQHRHDHPVGVFGKRPGNTGAAMAALFAPIGKVRFLALRGRQARVVRCLGGRGKLGLQRRHTRRERQNQGDTIIMGQGLKSCAVHRYRELNQTLSRQAKNG